MKNIVITGANRGIGLALTELYLAQGHAVYALCRQASPDLSASKAIIIENVDVGQQDTLAQALKPLANLKIDILINNAGILGRESFSGLDVKSIEQQFSINAVAPLLVTQLLHKNLVKGAKVALITSRMGSMTDNGSGGYYGYRMSKAALNMAGVSLAHELKGQGVAVALLHPGFVQTDMVNHAGDVSASDAATGLAARITELTLATSGTFWHANGEILPW